jgi:hypothetical protein
MEVGHERILPCGRDYFTVNEEKERVNRVKI